MVIETSSEQGMISLNHSLIDLIRRGEISLENALLYSTNPSEIQSIMREG
jgi:Tfp pilus assembly pilus retraction ATPase PilT